MTAFMKTLLASGGNQIVHRMIRRNYQSLPQYEQLLRPFNATYVDMKKHLLDKLEFDELKQQFGETLDYKLTKRGRQLRATTALKVHQVMAPAANLDSEGFQRIHVMGWICELMQSAALILDDYMDESEMRRGLAPWYVGREKLVATHVPMLMFACHTLLRDYFGKDAFFDSADVLTRDSNIELCTQQLADDLKFAAVEKKNLPWDFYKFFAEFKSRYCVVVPFKLAAYEATRQDLQFGDLVEDILKDFAIYLSVVNDCLNIVPRLQQLNQGAKDFEEDIKKKNMNLQLVIMLNNGTELDKDILLANLGKDDQRCIEIVRGLYKKYNVVEECEKFVDNLNISMRSKIAKVPNENKLGDGLLAQLEILELYTSLNASKIRV